MKNASWVMACGLAVCLGLGAWAADDNGGAGLFPEPPAPAGPPAQPELYDVSELKEVGLYKIAGVTEGKEQVTVGRDVSYEHFFRVQTIDFLTQDHREVFFYEPKEGSPLLKVLKGSSPDDLMAISTEAVHARLHGRSISRYEMHDGEERPGVFLYVTATMNAAGPGSGAAVKLYKFGHFVSLRLPKVKSGSEANSAEAKLYDAANKLAPGQMV